MKPVLLLPILLSYFYTEVTPSKIKTPNLHCKPPSAPEGVHYIPSHSGQGSLGMIGDVSDVISGTVTSQTEHFQWTLETTGSFGFGAAAIGPLSGLGEAIFANGIAIVRSTDNGTKEYFQTITSAKFRSPFALFVSQGTQSDGDLTINLSTQENISLGQIYAKLYESVGRLPFCFYGLTGFAQLNGIAVSKAPIYSEPLFGPLQPTYYTQPNFNLSNEYGLVFGCAANFSEIRDPQLLKRLGKLLYINPMDSGANGELTVHSHAVTLRDCLERPEEIGEKNLRDVYHLLTESKVRWMEARVFKLDKEKMVELKGHTSGGTCGKSFHFYFGGIMLASLVVTKLLA